MASNVRNLVISLSSSGDGVLIGLLVLFSVPVMSLHLSEVRAILFFIHVQLLIPVQALWSGPVNSLCQVFIIIFANIFLATRLVHQPLVQSDSMPIPDFHSIHGLTKSLVQSLTPMFFSIIAFVFGLVSIVATTWTPQCVILSG